MPHVCIETNWVVAYAAPAHHTLQVPAASALLDRAAEGELVLHLPSICISESRRPLYENFQVQTTADRVRQFLLWARDRQHIGDDEDEITRRVLDKMQGFVKRDLGRLEDTLTGLRQKAGLHIFDITHEIAQRCTELSFTRLGLKPFDQMILAAVLVRAEELTRAGEIDLAFCGVDADLQPWDRLRNAKPVSKVFTMLLRSGYMGTSSCRHPPNQMVGRIRMRLQANGPAVRFILKKSATNSYAQPQVSCRASFGPKAEDGRKTGWIQPGLCRLLGQSTSHLVEHRPGQQVKGNNY